LLAKYETDFIPYTFQLPVSIVVAKVAADYRLLDLVALDEPQYRSHVMTKTSGAAGKIQRPTLVSFNGRRSTCRSAGRLPLCLSLPNCSVNAQLRSAAEPLQLEAHSTVRR
jgi:hypothetical protein